MVCFFNLNKRYSFILLRFIFFERYNFKFVESDSLTKKTDFYKLFQSVNKKKFLKNILFKGKSLF